MNNRGCDTALDVGEEDCHDQGRPGLHREEQDDESVY